MTRWLRRVLIGAAALLLVGLVGVVGYAFTLPEDDLTVVEPGDLEVAEAAFGSWTVGSLEVTLSADGLVVREAGRTVWENPLDRAFLSAARGTIAVEQHRGYFWPEVAHTATWAEQRVESVEATAEQVRLSGTLAGDRGEVAWSATFSARPGGGAVLAAEVPDAQSVALSSGRSPGAGVHGFGEQFTDFDLDDRLLPIIVREQGVGRGEQPLSLMADLTDRSAAGDATTTYAAVASWVTDDLRGVALADDRPASHAFAVADTRDDERVTLEVWAPTLEAELTAADSPADLVAARHVGAPTLPEWTQHGAIVGIQGGTEAVRRRVADLRASGAEIAAVWLQDWTGRRPPTSATGCGGPGSSTASATPAGSGWSPTSAGRASAVTTYVNPFLVDAAAEGRPGRPQPVRRGGRRALPGRAPGRLAVPPRPGRLRRRPGRPHRPGRPGLVRRRHRRGRARCGRGRVHGRLRRGAALRREGRAGRPAGCCTTGGRGCGRRRCGRPASRRGSRTA